MPQAASYGFLYHQFLVLFAGAVCLFGTWVGMRHFARARATEGATRRGWLFMASVGTGVALWASTFISILALDPALNSGFEPVATGVVLIIAIIACLVGFEIGSRHFTLAPEAGGLVMGIGILAMHLVAFAGWHVAGTVHWNVYGVAVTFMLGLSLSALAVNRANRPVTRWCRHGAAIVLAFMVCTMHYALTASETIIPNALATLPSWLDPGAHAGLCRGRSGAAGHGQRLLHLCDRPPFAHGIGRPHSPAVVQRHDDRLPNRIAFNERLTFDAAEAHEMAHKVAAFSIDVDGFKDVNDVLGHSAGDQLLIQIANRMRGILGPGEFLARQSGDEFLGLKTSGNHPEDAQAFAERIAEVFAAPFQIGEQPVNLTASIGYSIFPTDNPARDHVLSNAKLAMYRGKSRQRGTITQYHQAMDDKERERRALARDVQTAAERNELELHYQLQMTLGDGQVCGAEALMRWHHPQRGMVSPAEFIPLAEETEAILGMGEWALRTACRDAAAGRIPGTIAVNLSPVQFAREDLAEMIHGILLESGLSPRRLEVEVTESSVMSDQSRALHILRKLKAMGISVAMDDFGTGYSSLATLHAFPFDKIKLDQSFVRRLPDDLAAAAIVRTVLALGESLGMPVLAEGIETEAQWRFLSKAGCAKGQGYLFARPVSVVQLPAAIDAAARFARDDEPALFDTQRVAATG